MSNEELLDEYEVVIAFYVTATSTKNDKIIDKYEARLQELKAEIISRMKK